jgi:hypothetical protein
LQLLDTEGGCGCPAGSVVDVLHRSLTSAVVLNAAQKGLGFDATDISARSQQLVDELTRQGGGGGGLGGGWPILQCTCQHLVVQLLPST